MFRSHSNRLGCLLSSPQPSKRIGNGSQGPRDYEVEKGLNPGVGFVDVLEVRIALV